MSLRYFADEIAGRLGGAWADARRSLRLAWYRADREAMAFAFMIGAALVAFGFGVHAVLARHARALELARDTAERMREAGEGVILDQFANPDKKVWAVVGDGGFQMTLCELATAQVHKIPAKCLIINNNFLGMVRQWQEMFFENRLSGVDLEGNPDFVKLAQAYGIKAFRIRRPADVDRILKQAIDYRDGPCVVVAEVVKEDNVFPMIPAGAPLSGMITEKPKHKLEKPTGST